MVREHFELKMWLQNELRRAIDGRRYLLVLDDYWDAELEIWRELKTLLVGGARGSKTLITKRLCSVANITYTASPYLLRGLSEMKSIDLLMQMAFPKGEETQDPDLRPIGEEIARRCSGVLLVVRTIGSLQFSNKTKAKWLHFKDYKLPEASRSEEEIMSVAEGFIKPSNTSEPLEDIAHEYFMNLLWSNFFQDFKKDPITEKETCKMHALACSVAGNECCVVGNDTKSIDGRTHHISVGDLPLPFPCLKASRLGTLIFFKSRMISEVNLCQLVQSFKMLHVLDLHKREIKKMPRSIYELKYLTYLDLSDNRWLCRLPNSIVELQNLQMLNLDGCYLEELPRGIRNLVSLRNLGIKYCERLSYVPRGLGQLSSLHRLNCFIFPIDKACAKNYGKLDELYMLNNIRGHLWIENLEHVTDTIEEYKAVNLIEKQFLKSLKLKWGSFNADDAVIRTRNEALSDRLQPPSNLQELTIIGYEGESFPSLLKLGIFYCKKLKAMPLTSCLGDNIFGQSVRHLPNLVYLSIGQCDALDLCKDESGDILDFQGLQSLRYVQIIDLPKLAYLPQ
ncbi:hypothetical protein EUGRSUZ_B00924 [Eucalyptus grandis]|uniref:Uncharacterized protein n=2 Tax=Eucalyptus grandis TaxID=71139 RepID=A0A059CZZ4_EUCGR|nr:hypothetical protein EUGRSUZ_B00924 [Eucalyptus grandis]